MPPPQRLLKLRQPGQSLSSRTQDATGAVLNPVAEAVGATPIMGAPPPPWIRPDLLAASGFTDVGAPFALTAYHRDCLGYVHVKFTLVTAAGAGGGTTVFLFDKSCRQSEALFFIAGDGNGNFREVSVDPTGAFVVIPATAGGDVLAGSFTFLAGS